MENDNNTSATTNTETTGQNQAVAANDNSDANIDSAIERGKEQKENAILKSYFKQQGMEEAEIQEAIKNWKEAKAKEKIEKEKAQKEAEAAKDQAVKEAEAKAEAAIKMLKNEKINNEVDRVAISLGVDPSRLGLISKLINKDAIEIGDDYIVNSETIKKEVESVLELVPEFKKQISDNAGGFRFGATRETTNTEAKPAKNLSLRESLALKYNS